MQGSFHGYNSRLSQLACIIICATSCGFLQPCHIQLSDLAVHYFVILSSKETDGMHVDLEHVL